MYGRIERSRLCTKCPCHLICETHLYHFLFTLVGRASVSSRTFTDSEVARQGTQRIYDTLDFVEEVVFVKRLQWLEAAPASLRHILSRYLTFLTVVVGAPGTAATPEAGELTVAVAGAAVTGVLDWAMTMRGPARMKNIAFWRFILNLTAVVGEEGKSCSTSGGNCFKEDWQKIREASDSFFQPIRLLLM